MRRIVSAVFAIAALGAGAAHGYSDLFAFGDSLSDGGNAYALAPPSAFPPAGFPPSPPYDQRFSNGQTAVERLAPMLGLPPLLPSTAGGTNYAVGGATTGLGNFNVLANDPPGLPASLAATGMRVQVDQFIGTGRTGLSDSLFVVWGGPNDLFLALATGGDPVAAAGQAVMNLGNLVGDLAAAGATRFLVPNLVNLGETPFGAGSGNPTALTALSGGFNHGLEQTMAQLESNLPGVDITVFDTFSLFDQVTGNPGAFGVTNATEPCVGNAKGCAGYLFFDHVHPTALGHTILAGSFHAAVVPEPETWAMLALGLVVLTVAARRRRFA